MLKPQPKPKEMLDVKFRSNDLNKTLTVRQYLKELLTTLWEEGEGFSGKRPFGNSGWQEEIYDLFEKTNVMGSYEKFMLLVIKEL